MATALQQPEVVPGNGFVSEEVRRLAEQARTERERQKQVLNLQRQRILSLERSQPARHAALEAALAQIDGEIKAMG
ncbi:MAG: hypothetical protein ABSC48_10180 [Terracidiphilus sp.]|jgi:hypothetical protein